jgi:hypothetical protein
MLEIESFYLAFEVVGSQASESLKYMQLSSIITTVSHGITKIGF